MHMARFPLLGAYDLCLKCSHLFNILDARGAISVTERVGVIARVRALAVGIAKAWVDQQRGESAAEQKLMEERKQKKERKLNPHPHNPCHPERRGNFAQRSFHAVEGPLPQAGCRCQRFCDFSLNRSKRATQLSSVRTVVWN